MAWGHMLLSEITQGHAAERLAIVRFQCFVQLRVDDSQHPAGNIVYLFTKYAPGTPQALDKFFTGTSIQEQEVDILAFLA